MNEKKITIKISGEGISFEDTIDKILVPQIINICVSQHKKVEENPFGDFSFFDNHSKNSKKQESVAEYIQRHNPKRNPDKILTIAGYIKDIQKRDSFFPNEIKSLFREAREILPANLTRDFNWVIASGWVNHDSEKKGSYYITNTGIKVLEEGFPENLIEKSRNKSYGRKKANDNTKKNK